MTNLSLESLTAAVEELKGLSELIIALKPTKLLVSQKYVKKAKRILGLIKRPVHKTSSMRKRKRALYWRETV